MAEEKKEETTKEETTQPAKEAEKEEKPSKVEDKKVEKEEKHSKPSKEEDKKEVPKKFEDLVKSIENLSVLELSELVKVLEERFGVSAAAPAAVAPAAAAPAEGGGESGEKSEYNIELKDAGDKKIETIKAVRTITGKGLKEAKDLVDAVAGGPQVIKEGVPAEEAKEAEKTLKEAGAVVELK